MGVRRLLRHVIEVEYALDRCFTASGNEFEINDWGIPTYLSVSKCLVCG